MIRHPEPDDDELSRTAAMIEREVLGALLHGEPVEPIRDLMPAAEFSTAPHQMIADAVYALAETGRPVCPTAVLDELHARRLAGRIDPVILIELYGRCELPAAGLYFAERARGYATLRTLRALGGQLAAAACVTDLDDIPELCRVALKHITVALRRLDTTNDGHTAGAVHATAQASGDYLSSEPSSALVAV